MALNRGQRSLLLLGVVFFAPLIVAIIVYSSLLDSTGFATKNHGELIIPARPLQAIEFTDDKNQTFLLSSLIGNWKLVYIGVSDCNDKCKTNLYNIRQTRLGQRGEHGRIERVYISLDTFTDSSLAYLRKEYAGMHFLTVKKSSATGVLAEFNTSMDAVRNANYGVYIIDPIGNLMMRYPDGYSAKGLAKDIELLLKASQMG